MHAGELRPLALISEAAWATALDAWRLRKVGNRMTGWKLRPKKAGRPKAGAQVYRLHVVLQVLLASGGLRPKAAAQRDADVIRDRLNRALNKLSA